MLSDLPRQGSQGAGTSSAEIRETKHRQSRNTHFGSCLLDNACKPLFNSTSCAEQKIDHPPTTRISSTSTAFLLTKLACHAKKIVLKRQTSMWPWWLTAHERKPRFTLVNCCFYLPKALLDCSSTHTYVGVQMESLMGLVHTSLIYHLLVPVEFSPLLFYLLRRLYM